MTEIYRVNIFLYKVGSRLLHFLGKPTKRDVLDALDADGDSVAKQKASQDEQAQWEGQKLLVSSYWTGNALTVCKFATVKVGQIDVTMSCLAYSVRSQEPVQ